jgi:hypothetical protein
MHRLPSSSAIRRIRLAALLLGANYLITSAAAAVLAYSFVIDNHKLTCIGISMFMIAGFGVLLQWFIAARATCPLCLAPVLGNKECAKHRHARTFLGSHRLRVALAVLCLNRFHCPFCGEPTALEIRPRKPH